MVQIIGLMIGMYILLRCIQLITEANTAARGFAVLTIFTTLGSMLLLLISGN